MSQTPLMPKATAVWLVENTSLTFEQIAEFCKLHPLEVRGIADGEVAAGIKGLDPITSGQLTREELERAAKNPNHHLKLAERKVKVPEIKRTKGPRYTPVSKRQDRPAALVEAGSTLLTVEEATAPAPVRNESQPFADMSRPKREEEAAIDVESVFAKLKQLKRPAEDEDDE